MHKYSDFSVPASRAREQTAATGRLIQMRKAGSLAGRVISDGRNLQPVILGVGGPFCRTALRPTRVEAQSVLLAGPAS